MEVKNTVLVVDDEKMIRSAVSAYFEKMGWRVCEAENVRAALALFEQAAVSFVILVIRILSWPPSFMVSMIFMICSVVFDAP